MLALSIVLRAIRPVVKSKMKSLLFEYQAHINNKNDIAELKAYLLEVFNEIIDDYIQEKKL